MSQYVAHDMSDSDPGNDEDAISSNAGYAQP